MTNDTLDTPTKTEPKTSLWNQIKYVLKPIASLQLTIVLFSMSLVLVFFGTLAQMNNGIWTVVDKYFWSMFVWIELDLVLKFLQVFFWFPKTWSLPSYVAVPDVASVRRFASRPGVALNVEQEFANDLGLFARASVNDGSKEAFEFTEINRSVSAGISMKGSSWHRPDDTAGFAAAVNALSGAARHYFAAGGIGILIGDGRLPRYGSEQIFEAYYSARLTSTVNIAANIQRVVYPAYNRDRGPVSIFGLRLHTDL